MSALTQLRARRSQAFLLGEAKARQRQISADAYLFLYKELVGLAGERTYCWPGLEFLVERLGTSEGTVKRWMKELEKADLIQRKPRPGGQTSLTYITVYLEAANGVEASTAQDRCDDDSDEAQHMIDGILSNALPADVDEVGTSLRPSVQPLLPPLFFGPDQEINGDRCAGSDLIPHTVKSQDFKSPDGFSGGAAADEPMPIRTDVDAEVLTLLKDEDVHDPDAITDLRNKPAVELQALSKYLDKQTNIRCRPGLFVWLARQDFGAKLLAGRQRREARRLHRQGVAERAELVANPSRQELVELWQRVLDQVSRELPQNDFATWLQPTHLLELDENDAFLGTPNIFVREQIEACFLDMLTEKLRGATDRPVQVHVVIESNSCSA
ncbi:MAG TPA: DnaA N-terminal domain-containing protein [Herpetosiphonaceae bacterium]|nr:DnaA N-terminal domain-containing protein [Herpetosiphonaceae bacterium]